MKNNISKIKNNCYGCFACFNICPSNAIEMKENEEGFKYPEVNANCSNCGLCKKVCPHLSHKFENNKNPECFAFLAEDNVRKFSSSGGVFPILAEYFIKHNGYVAGAVYNENIEVQHVISNKIDVIEKMRNSKYLQSSINDCYQKTKQILDEEHLVLFTGTPCQIAGLNTFLQKDYENLYCVDIICHGVPSPKVFKKYIKEMLKKKNEKWLNTNFRDKVMGGGWSSPTSTTITSYKTNSTQNDYYMKAFLSNICLRKTCSNCKFQIIPRQGDLTIGDFWGVWNFDKNLNDEKGTSVILKNNSKGSFLIKILQNNAKIFKTVPLQYAISGNPCLTNSSVSHNARNLFFRLINKKTLKESYNICDLDKVDFIIVNFWYTMNYGASVTAYAMQTLLESLNYTSMLLNRNSAWDDDLYEKSFSKKFAINFLNLSKVYNLNDLKVLSKNIKGVILGSDQVLRLDYIISDIHKFLLNWVNLDTRKIALAPSFGINKKEFLKSSFFTSNTSKTMKNALNSFDYLSCREISGKEIYKDVFDLDADWIFDPVFLIDKKEYDKILLHATIDNSNKIVSYVLDDAEEYDNLYKYLSNKENANVVKINDQNYLVEDWLASIKDCKLLITDSFHGVCFALLFNKPFICIRNKKRGNARFETLIETFDISNNFVFSIDEIYREDFNYDVDYKKLNQKILQKREKDLVIIKKVLNGSYSNNPIAKASKIKNIKYLKKYNLCKSFKLKISYYRCRLLANFTFGSKKLHYINKKHLLKEQLNKI